MVLILDMVKELTEATAYLDQLRQLEEVPEAIIINNKLVLLVAQVVAVLILGRVVPHLLQLKDLQVVLVILAERKHQVVEAVLEQLVLMALAVRLAMVVMVYRQVSQVPLSPEAAAEAVLTVQGLALEA